MPEYTKYSRLSSPVKERIPNLGSRKLDAVYPRIYNLAHVSCSAPPDTPLPPLCVMPTTPLLESLAECAAIPVLIGTGIAATYTMTLGSSESSPPFSKRNNSSANPWSDQDDPRQTKSNSMTQLSSTPYTEDRRAFLKEIAQETLRTMQSGHFVYKGVEHDLKEAMTKSRADTKFYSPDSATASWASPAAVSRTRKTGNINGPPAHVSVLQISTLDAARLLEGAYKQQEVLRARTGVLNFASATQPGGGFKNGAEAQEESIARASTLYASLMTDEAGKFYGLHRDMEHRKPPRPFYTHAIVYSPGVRVFRDDDGVGTYPFDVDVLSCAAVNAGEVRKNVHGPAVSGLEVEIEQEMSERMGRILHVFELYGVRNLILGTFGTGVFRNNIQLVARLWAHLLVVPDARFKHSFDRIIFAITGDETYAVFQNAFEAWSQRRPTGSNSGSLIQF